MKIKFVIILIMLSGVATLLYSQEENGLAPFYGQESFNISPNKHYSVSRFMKIFTANGIDNYSSPSVQYSAEGIPYSLFPLNFYSSDLIPMRGRTAGRINRISSFALSETENNLNFEKREIPEDFEVNVLAYIGSETGDPLIHLYTRPNNPETNGNINKIVPSGLLTISNSIGDNSYRISTGYFGYFITGSKIDGALIRLNPYYYPKQNKQIYAGVDFQHNYSKSKNLKISSDFISYYGWDFPPFIGEAVHFENYVLSSKLDFTRNNAVSLTLKNDVVLNDIHNTSFFNGTKSLYTETSFYPAYMIEKNSLTLNISGSLNYLTAANKQAARQQQYLSKELNKLYGNAALNTGIKLLRDFTAGFSVKYLRHYNDEDYVSYNAKLTYQKSYSAIGVKYSSDVKTPNFNELYGQFAYAYSDTSYLFPEHYFISGNENLNAERDNAYSLFFKAADTRQLYMLKGDIFYKTIRNQIGKIPIAEKSYKYINYAEGNVFGGGAEFLILLSEWGRLTAVYNYLDNKDFSHASKHNLFSQFIYYTDFNSEISLAVKYKSKQDWSRQHAFLLPAENIISESAVFNIYYEQKIENFYFLDALSFKIEVENIFDRSFKNIPRENSLRRAVVFYLDTCIY